LWKLFEIFGEFSFSFFLFQQLRKLTLSFYCAQARQTCNSNTHQCECIPATCAELGNECGTGVSDLCGGTLTCNGGTCPSGMTCSNNRVCVSTTCTPTTSCAVQGKTCGTIDNGCGTVSCGQCTTPNSCLTNGTCGCIPKTSCAAEGLTCGTLFDGCTTQVCGDCNKVGPNYQCVTGQCQCVPTTTCAKSGK
jgi:hypothetical protein